MMKTNESLIRLVELSIPFLDFVSSTEARNYDQYFFPAIEHELDNWIFMISF